MNRVATQNSKPEKKSGSIPEVFNEVHHTGVQTVEALKNLRGKFEETPKEKEKRIAHIEKELEKLAGRIEGDLERERIRRDIAEAAKKGDFKGVAQEMKAHSSIKEDRETQEKIDELVSQQDEYGAMAQKIKALKNLKDRLPEWIKDLAGGDGLSPQNLDEIVDQYYVYDEKKNTYRAKTHIEIALEAWNKSDGFFEGIWAFGKGFITGRLVGKHTKDAEGAVNAGLKVRDTVDHIKEEHGETIEKVKIVGAEVAHGVKKGGEVFKEGFKNNPEVAAAAKRKAGEMVNNAKEGVKDMARSVVRGKNPEASVKAFKETLGGVLHEVKTAPSALRGAVISEIQAGKVPGLAVKGVGKMAVIAVVSQGIRDAIKNEDPSQFMDTISNSNLWLEMIPLVGSYNSIARAFEDNGDPWWAKTLDVGLNVVGDGLLAASIIGTAGLGTGVGVGAKAFLSGLARGALKLGTKQGIKEVAVHGTKVAAQGAKVVGKGAKELGEKAVQTVTTREGRKNALKATQKTIGAVATYTLAMEILERTIATVFPVEVIKEMTVKIAQDELKELVSPYVSPGFESLYEVMSGKELNLRGEEAASDVL